MSVSSVSSTPAYQPPQPNPAVKQNMQQLVSSLQSGDLSGAQTAYAALSQSLPGSNGTNNQNNPFQQGIAAIGAALQSGDLSGAQSALQSLQSQMKGAHHGHHHHGQGSSSASSSASSSTTSADISTLTATTPSISLLA
jgi:hypothetical protein